MSTQTITGNGTVSDPVEITGKTLSPMLPSFLAAISAGGSLTYNIEATGNSTDQAVSTWVWTPMTYFTDLTTSADGTLQAMPMYLRARITAYTSGTLTFQVTQPSAR